MTESLMDHPDAARLTFDGQLALQGVTPHPEPTVRVSTLSGANMQITVPTGWQVGSISTQVLFDSGPGAVGFQSAPRGSSLIHLLAVPDHVTADAVVTLGDGVLAFYTLDLGPESVSSATLWQGPWSDVYTFDFATFDEALDSVASFMPQDSEHGATLQVSPALSIAQEAVTVDCWSVVLEVRQRDASMTPLWAGAEGTHVQLYRADDDADWVLAVTPSAVASISTVPVPGQEPDHPVPPSDEDIAALAQELDLSWS